MVELALKNVGVELGGRRVLYEVSLGVVPGEVLIILGPNGAGKSTLLRIFSGEMEADTGSVMIDDIALRDLSPAALARRRSLMPQQASLSFPFLVRDVVAMGRAPFRSDGTHHDDETAIAWGMAATEVTLLARRPYTRLSGGEQQRVQLARVLAQSWRPRGTTTPRYLLLDEPTASLDLAHQHATLHLARDLALDGAGVVAVVHDLNLAALYADRVAVMSNGSLVALGRPDDVLIPDMIARVFGLEVRRIHDPSSDRHFILPTGQQNAANAGPYRSAAQ